MNAPIIEQEAELFAQCLLAPACVLRAMGVTEREDIARICGMEVEGVAYPAAQFVLLDKDGLPADPLERAVYQQFLPFIERYLAEQRRD